MKKSLLGLVTLLLLASVSVYAQTVTGKVTSATDGAPIPGASVLIKGTSIGTATDTGGNFILNVADPENGVLVISFIGFLTQEVALQNRTSLNIALQEDATQLSEVVVTALGIEKDTKSLSYSLQQVKGDQLTNAQDVNMINSLAGKVAGITMNRSASGIGGSTRVTLRGNKSTTNNAPLYVIDGVPMLNTTPAQPTDVWGQSSGTATGGRDGGDGISNLNPDDIESINVLKGASAAALYGSQAANGVILINTKKGKAGKTAIDFSSNLTFETPLMLPKLQYKYGQTDPGSDNSWGGVVNAPDHVDDFFQTGKTWINSISLSAGTDKAQTYFSYSHADNKGILPTSEFKRHTFNFRETAKFLNDKLTVDGNISFITQKANNRAVSGLYNNPLTGLYLFPRGLDFNDYKNNYETFSLKRNMNSQNWWNINEDAGLEGEGDQQNPYWALYRTVRSDGRDRANGSLTLNYKLLDWLSIQARGRFDKSIDKYELKSYAGTQKTLSAKNGRYTWEQIFNTQLYGDLLLTANKQLNDDFSLTATLGTSVNDFKYKDGVTIDTNPSDEAGGLVYANNFILRNIQPSAERIDQTLDRKQIQSVFATAQVGFKDKLFLDVTARNDWSSTFAFTSTASKGFFYYSGGLTAVLSEMVTLPEVISFAKLRASYAKVGNDVPSYYTNPRDYSINGSRTGIDVTRIGPNPYQKLKPEDNRSFEVGAELRFLDNRISLDATYYINNNYDQFVTVESTDTQTDYSTYYFNAGNIRNSGVELSLSVVPLKNELLEWTSTFNFAANRNKIVDLSDESIGLAADQGQVLNDFGNNMYGLFLKEGGSWGDLYANKVIARDANGVMIVDENGVPQTTGGAWPNSKYIGNPQPKATVGWNNTVAIKNFNVSVLVDGRFGGKVVSVTQAYLDYYGVSQASADARDAGGVNVPAVTADGQPFDGPLPAKEYYRAIGYRSGAAELYTYDATNIRLREFSVGYRFPKVIPGIRHVSLSVVGRNLFFISKDAPFDPDLTMSTGNALQGVDVFGLPSTRSWGFNLKVGF